MAKRGRKKKRKSITETRSAEAIPLTRDGCDGELEARQPPVQRRQAPGLQPASGLTRVAVDATRYAAWWL